MIYKLVTAFVVSVLQECTCSWVVLQASSTPKTFTSPNYPSSYPSNTGQTWVMQSSNESDVITIDVLDSEIEYSTTCVYDYAIVHDGSDTSSSILQRFCGESTPRLTSTGNSLLVYFYSDNSVQRKGFKIQYSSSRKTVKRPTINDEPIKIGLGVIGSIIALTVIGALAYYIFTRKGRTPSVSRTNVQTLSYQRPADRSSRYFHYRTPRTLAGVNNMAFYNNPGEALPDYRTLFPLTPPPPYSEIDTRAAP